MKLNDLVLARFQNYPAWPAIVRTCFWRDNRYNNKWKLKKPARYWCFFINDDSANWVAVEDVKLYSPSISVDDLANKEDDFYENLKDAIRSAAEIFLRRQNDPNASVNAAGEAGSSSVAKVDNGQVHVATNESNDEEVLASGNANEETAPRSTRKQARQKLSRADEEVLASGNTMDGRRSPPRGRVAGGKKLSMPAGDASSEEEDATPIMRRRSSVPKEPPRRTLRRSSSSHPAFVSDDDMPGSTNAEEPKRRRTSRARNRPAAGDKVGELPPVRKSDEAACSSASVDGTPVLENYLAGIALSSPRGNAAHGGMGKGVGREKPILTPPSNSKRVSPPNMLHGKPDGDQLKGKDTSADLAEPYQAADATAQSSVRRRSASVALSNGGASIGTGSNGNASKENDGQHVNGKDRREPAKKRPLDASEAETSGSKGKKTKKPGDESSSSGGFIGNGAVGGGSIRKALEQRKAAVRKEVEHICKLLSMEDEKDNLKSKLQKAVKEESSARSSLKAKEKQVQDTMRRNSNVRMDYGEVESSGSEFQNLLKKQEEEAKKMVERIQKLSVLGAEKEALAAKVKSAEKAVEKCRNEMKETSYRIALSVRVADSAKETSAGSYGTLYGFL